MSPASISQAALLSILFFLTISGLSLTAIFLAVQQMSKRRAHLAAASGITLVVFFLALSAAQATDRVIINGTGCQVTEEDSIGIYLHQDLYLRIDYPNTHWRFGLRNMGMKGTQALDVTLQGAQYTSPQYLIKRAGLAEMFVPYDDRSETYYDMSFGDNRMDQMDPADLPATNAALVYFRNQHGQLLYPRYRTQDRGRMPRRGNRIFVQRAGQPHAEAHSGGCGVVGFRRL